MASPEEQEYGVLVPSFQEEARIAEVVSGVLRYCRNVIVIDDGSADRTAEEAARAGAVVLKHEANRGKGAALNTGFAHARQEGYEFVITLDADGQHDPSDIPAFVETYRSTGVPVIIGNRMDRASGMPWIRRATNRFMSWLLSRRIGQRVPDSQCGYRLYGREALPLLSTDSDRFAAESEVLLGLGEQGIRMGHVPIKVIYGEEKSKIRPVRDTVRFFGMLRRHRRAEAGGGRYD